MLIILFHELGHLALVRLFKLRPRAIVLHALGGECSYSGAVTPAARQAIAWGGVLGQALLYPASLALRQLHGDAAAELAQTLATTNFELALFNLVPISPLDGYEAWGLGRRPVDPVLEQQRQQRSEVDEVMRLVKGLKGDLDAANSRATPAPPRRPDRRE